MIQRQQTLWLLLSTVAAVLTFMFPFATGEEVVDKTTMRRMTEIVAGSDFFLLILSIATVGLSAVTIFMFKDRKMQIRLCLLGLVIAVITLVRYFMVMKKLITSTPALWAVLPVAVIIGYFMAFRLIRKDEKLVKSLDKLR
ncbi:MAG: DUF4293 domain-containing protein [Chitinophagaceae bacterium]|nr:DUF4293 domain-containing protein [Chitinophagaceae bacterium]MBL7747729.1 DUF4293 domain-containing protein [Chitinophagaceae bacterium]